MPPPPPRRDALPTPPHHAPGGEAPATSTTFALGFAVIALSFVVGAAIVATREWFKHDDFAFLAAAASDGFSWLATFLPMGEGRYWSYRPVSLDGYFRVAHRLFGMNAWGYFALNLLARLGAGALLFRLARQLGFGLTAAAATALLSVSRPPSVDALYWAVGSCYVGIVLFATLTLTLQIDDLRGRGVRWRVGALVALALALLSHESAVIVPGVATALAMLERHRAGAEVASHAALLAALRATAGLWLLTAGYLVLRTTQVALPADSLYEFALSPERLFKHATALVGHAFGAPPAVLLGTTVGAAAVGLSTRSGREAALRWYAPMAAVALVWTLGALAPVVALPFAHPRFAIPSEPAVALLFGGLLELSLRAWPTPRPTRALELAILVVLVAAMPFTSLRARAVAPGGAAARQLVGVLDARASLPARGRVIVLYGMDGLATFGQARRFRASVFGSGLLRASHPDLDLGLDFLHLEQQDPGLRHLCDECIYLRVTSAMEFDEAPADFVSEHVYGRALAANGPVFMAAATRLALARGEAAARPILEACDRTGDPRDRDVCFARVVATLRDRGDAEAEAAAWKIVAGHARALPQPPAR